MLRRRGVTEIALARSEHYISNTQTESLPNFWANPNSTVRLENLEGFVPTSVAPCRNKAVRTPTLLAPGRAVSMLKSQPRFPCPEVCPQLSKAQAAQLSQGPCDSESAQLLLKWGLPGYLQHTYCSCRLSLSSPAVPPAWTPGALLQLLLLSHSLVIASSWQWDKAISEDTTSLCIWRTLSPL